MGDVDRAAEIDREFARDVTSGTAGTDSSPSVTTAYVRAPYLLQKASPISSEITVRASASRQASPSAAKNRPFPNWWRRRLYQGASCTERTKRVPVRLATACASANEMCASASACTTSMWRSRTIDSSSCSTPRCPRSLNWHTRTSRRLDRSRARRGRVARCNSSTICVGGGGNGDTHALTIPT